MTEKDQDLDKEVYTTERKVVANNGKTYTVPDWAPRRVRVDKQGRPELFMHPSIFQGKAEPSSVRGPRKGA